MDSWEPAEPTAGFDGRLYAQIEADQARRSGFWGRLGSWKPAWATAGLAATLAMALWIARSDVIFPAGPAEAPKVALSSEDAEYLRALEGALDDIEMLVDFEALALHEADDGRS
jgi:anti-sigma-K factor RskA